MWHIDIYNLEFIEMRLRLILKAVEDEFGPGCITSLFRTGDLGVHGTLPLRGIDERCKSIYLGNLKVAFVNSLWIYDPQQPDLRCALCHDVGQGLHMHYQVHPNTVRVS
jgi:hypothetical protein